MALVLKLTDGTTTLNLNDGTNYGVPYDEWSPAVASRRRGQLGGWQHNDVAETIPLHVRGATGAAALANLVAVVELLDQAERWARGENVDAVRLQYKPHNSSLGDPIEAVVLGGPTNGLLQLSPRMNDFANYEIPDLQLRLLRRGLWLSDAGGGTPDAPVTNPAVAEVDFGGALDVPAPTLVALRSDISSAGGAELPAAGYVLIADGDHRLFVEDVGNVSDSANHALGGNVSRLQASAASSFATLVTAANVGGASPPDDTVTRWAVFAALRAAAPDWILRAQVAGSFGIVTTRELGWSPSGAPEIVHLGTVAVDFPVLDVIVQARALASTSDYIYCDYIALLAVDSGRALSFRRGGASSMISTGLPIVIDPRALRSMTGSVHTVHEDTPDLLVQVPYAGDPFFISQERRVYAAVLATSGSSWRWRFDSANVQYDLAATRRPGYLVPQ